MLLDPKNINPPDYKELAEKLVAAKTLMARSPKEGGMPFIYTFIASKEHLLWTDFPKYIDRDGKEKVMETAATDGRRYFWHENFLRKLSIKKLMLVLAHEAYHVIMVHCDKMRVFGKNPTIWNLAVDYVVNYSIEFDAISVQKNLTNTDSFEKECNNAYKNNTVHPIWNEELGTPYKFADLIASIMEFQGLNDEEIAAKIEEHKKLPEKRVIYADFSLYGRSAESIYDEIMDARKKSGLSEGDFNSLVQQVLDAHLESDISRKELLEQLIQARSTCKRMNGTTPGSMEAILAELENPTLKWEDLCRQSMTNKRRESGNKNDWSRLRRRSLALDLYMPRKKDIFIRWLCMLDTSGSMSDSDIAYGISQLKCLDSRSEGIVVPVDSVPYWDKAVKIKTLTELPKINVVGRGGTVFDEFFNDYKKHIKEQIDLIIVITDGCFSLNCIKPRVDTVFVITNDSMPDVPFGRVAPLRKAV